MELIGLGVDLCEVGRMERELARAGGGFRDAVFTSAEVSSCAATRTPARQLAAYFAAKEAVFKALRGSPATSPAWQEIEIALTERGLPEVRLHGEIAALAKRLGAAKVRVSFSHTRELAIAFAAAAGDRVPLVASEDALR